MEVDMMRDPIIGPKLDYRKLIVEKQHAFPDAGVVVSRLLRIVQLIAF
jgi:hypothetical protein